MLPFYLLATSPMTVSYARTYLLRLHMHEKEKGSGGGGLVIRDNTTHCKDEQTNVTTRSYYARRSDAMRALHLFG